MEAVTVVMVTVIVATVVATRVAVVEGTIETGKNLVPFFIRHAFSTFVNQYLLIFSLIQTTGKIMLFLFLLLFFRSSSYGDRGSSYRDNYDGYGAY